MFVPFELVGRRFEKYQISEFIGRGPMAYVFRALDPETQQTLALKLFPKTQAGSPDPETDFRETFFKEFEAARKLIHPNVSIILDAGETADFHYLCTEFIPGKSLEDIINERGPLPLEEALPLFRQILEGLEAAHQKHLAHRNLKPSNILVQRNGQIKLTDFAQAKVPSMAATMAFSGAGSPYYMAPEQLLGQRGDIRSDIFSVGTLLYRVLTGEKPFDGESTATIVGRVVQQEAVSPKKINPHIPGELEKVCAKAMAKDPAGRYPTPGDMLADLPLFQPAETAPIYPTPAALEVETEPPTEAAVLEEEKFPTEKLSAVPRGVEEPSGPAGPKAGETGLPREEAALPTAPVPQEEAPPGRFGFKALGVGVFLILALITAVVLLVWWPPAPIRSKGSPSPGAPTAAPPVIYSTPTPTQAPTIPSTPTAPPPVPAPLSPAQPAVVPTDQLIEQAKAVWNTDQDQARRLLEKAAAQSPNDFEAHFQLGRLLTQKKLYPAALQEYQQALYLNNRVPEVYFNLGYIHLIQGNYDLAIQHLEWCRALNPAYQDEVLTNIGVVYLRKRNLAQARLYLKEALQMNPRNDLARDYLKKLESGEGERKKKERHD